MQRVILSILDPDSVETAINNMVEAGLTEDTISLIMQDATIARKIIDDAGPLQGVTASTLAQTLQQRGVDKQLVEKYVQLVEQGKALLAVSGSQEAITLARSIVKDYPTQDIVEV